MQEEFGREYLNRLHDSYTDMPGLADYCVYWFRKAHDNLKENGRAGLVGTNTISQTYSRKGGLDYIVQNNGTIIEAVASMPWSGTANVHVAIVNWIKGKTRKKFRKLAIQRGNKKDGPWEEYELNYIPSSLSPFTDVTKAKRLLSNIKSKTCYQGQTHGHEGFLLTLEEQEELLKKESIAKEVVYPYLIAEELIGKLDSQPERFVIDFQPRDIYSAKKYQKTFSIIEEKVLPTREEAYEREKKRNEIALAANSNAKTNHHHERFYKKWWLLSYGREELISKLNEIKRYVVCSQVTKRPIFEFISTEIRPNAALIVFPMDDDYSFGILQSSIHWEWFKANCSTLTERFRYTSNTVFDTFPWPQWGILHSESEENKKENKIKIQLALNVAKAAKELRDERNKIRKENNLSLRDLYRTLELPGENKLKKAQEKLDKSVWDAYFYGMLKKSQKKKPLEFLLNLNELCYNTEIEKRTIMGPGLPPFCMKNKQFYSDDCIRLP